MILHGLTAILHETRGIVQDIVAMLREVRGLVCDIRQRGGDSPSELSRPEDVRPEDMAAAAAENERIAREYEAMLGGQEEARTDRVRVVAATPQWPTDKASPVGAEGTVAYVCGVPQFVTLPGFGQVPPGGIRWEVIPDGPRAEPTTTLTEQVQWVYITAATPEWLAAHGKARLAPVDDPSPVALVYQNGLPVRIDGIPGAPAASPAGLTWAVNHPKNGSRVATHPISP